MPPSNDSQSLLRRIPSAGRSPLAFALCLAGILLAYRVQLTLGLFRSPVRPFDFSPGSHAAHFVLVYLPYDLALILASFLIVWFLSRGACLFKNKQVVFWLNLSGWIFLHGVILGLLVIHAAHIRLLFNAQTGLDTAMIREVWTNIPSAELLNFISRKEALLLLIPIGIFWVAMLLPCSCRLWIARVSVILLLLLLLSSLWAFAAGRKEKNIPSEIRLNPPLFLLSDIAERAFARSSTRVEETARLSQSGEGLRREDSTDALSVASSKWLPAKSDRPWNVVFFIMESAGTRYAFDAEKGLPMPMSFVHGLSKEGWYLRRHFSPSNISNKAIFSILSGLYDFFNRETFCIRSDTQVPSVYNFLEDTHESFFVTPTPITWYFPTAFLKNSGLPEIHSFENLPLKVKEEYHSLGHYIGRDETQTVDFFINRINRAREPFLGIYLSFAAHLPYFDYGPAYRVREEDGRSITRYYNNLNLLDHMIRRIYDNLKDKGLLGRTILVIVGDHGQAFGQHHPDNFMHYRYSYNENLEAPAVFYQPALLGARVFDRPTSHIDLLPTLLDAMRLPYDPNLFNGESLFQRSLKRQFLCFYGYEESVSSLHVARQTKVQYSLKKGACWTYDLKADPGENHRLDCASFQDQMEALRQFTLHHDARLAAYNERLKKNREIQVLRNRGDLKNNTFTE